MDENDKTIAAYEKDFDQYVKFVDRETREYRWIYDGLEGLPKDVSIFEVGSGMGIEADKVEELGYHVQRSDATESFRRHLESEGKRAVNFNIKTDLFPDVFDVIIASAVLLHFSREDFRVIIRKILQALKPNGRLLFSVQNGKGEEWKENKGGPRYFCYWTDKQLMQELDDAGFSVINIGSILEEKWWTVSAERKHES